MWRRVYDALRRREEPRSYTVDAQFYRIPETSPDELTEDIIIAEQPDWIAPIDARRDPWRPRTTLG
jgi:hypothetical protein